jgi:hypothetical protein
MNGQCIITKPADPKKLYKLRRKLHKKDKNKITLDQAKYINEMKLARQLRDMF